MGKLRTSVPILPSSDDLHNEMITVPWKWKMGLIIPHMALFCNLHLSCSSLTFILRKLRNMALNPGP